MCREYNSIARAGPTGCESIEVHAFGASLDKLSKFLVGLLRIDIANALAQMPRALHEGAVHNPSRERPQSLKADLPNLKATG